MSDKLTPFLTPTPLPRRMFLRAAGVTAATSALVLAGCSDDDESTPVAPTTPLLSYTNGVQNITANNIVFNYLYSLHQLTLAFYQAVVAAFPTDMPVAERTGFTDLRDHELIYTESYKYLLGTNGIASLAFSFTTLTLTTRAGVLAAAKKFEDLLVAAYNDVVTRFSMDATGRDYLLFTGKIASVKARHAAYVRDLEVANSFAGTDVVVSSGDLAGLDATLTPSAVVTALAPYFTVTVVTSNTAALA
ncbi:ferritin-like domain-containing protein [Hymenobacter aerilatus]|uniref:Ferritin-like domain-containing protein n=1 Tax=Hymenobacter aerilatus TaxID=2932251 RepID=A0A8T9STJ4_9BACT|nr:ferritin-like domain-containing protein [Hymenobacter aerilatus]UOR05472.1 ferritin-like domain-containing protein [Hymenobacter aerilatus]